ncbi:MAG: hypothetical protein ABJF10_13400 [Chthoniobacter sp.]|uniref:hypothetical protein n=1 Tax=Chthoniobacter sp. TaxID=2510640 RepID=UPI0032A4B81A
MAERYFSHLRGGSQGRPRLPLGGTTLFMGSVTENPHPQDRFELIKEALFIGRKVAAIKLYQQQTGLGPADAKAAIEKLEAELRLSSPERFTRPLASGCFSAILFVGLGVVLWKALA